MADGLSRAKTPILATVDDHDYGVNDGDKHWKYKQEAKELLIDHFDQVSPTCLSCLAQFTSAGQDPRLGIASRANQSTMHVVWRTNFKGLRVRVILLDNRWVGRCVAVTCGLAGLAERPPEP